MTEPFYVKLEIGGECSEAVAARLIELINEQSPDDGPIVDDDTGYLSAQFPNVNYGNLETIEPFCKEHGLTWRKYVDGKSGFDSQIDCWKPGDETVSSFLSDAQGNPVIEIAAVRKYLDNPALATVEHIRALLNEHTPPEPPKFVVRSNS